MYPTNKPPITKAKAKEILQVNYGSVDNAALKLKDPYLIQSTAKTSFPVTETVLNYLKELDYNVSNLSNECIQCGIKYYYTPMCSDTLCRYCNNYNTFGSKLIVEPTNKDELIKNLIVLSEVFDHEISSINYSGEIAALSLL